MYIYMYATFVVVDFVAVLLLAVAILQLRCAVEPLLCMYVRRSSLFSTSLPCNVLLAVATTIVVVVEFKRKAVAISICVSISLSCLLFFFPVRCSRSRAVAMSLIFVNAEIPIRISAPRVQRLYSDKCCYLFLSFVR